MKKPQTGRKGNVIRKERDDRKHLPPGDTATCRDRFSSTVDLIVQEKKITIVTLSSTGAGTSCLRQLEAGVL